MAGGGQQHGPAVNTRTRTPQRTASLVAGADGAAPHAHAPMAMATSTAARIQPIQAMCVRW